MPGARGFTLIELALAIFILGLVIGSLLIPLHTQVEQRQTRETQRQLEQIREALIGFALAKGYLPCPDKISGASSGVNDSPNDGMEDFLGTGACSVIAGSGQNLFSMGNVPWVTLGLGQQDAWGNRFRYTVLSGFAQRSPATSVTLSTNDDRGNLRVCATATCVATDTLSTTAVAVILSHGSNGYGAVNSANVTNSASASADEIANTDSNRDFVSRPRFTGGVDTSEFDDIVIWLSRYTLFNRMTAAGSLSP